LLHPSKQQFWLTDENHLSEIVASHSLQLLCYLQQIFAYFFYSKVSFSCSLLSSLSTVYMGYAYVIK